MQALKDENSVERMAKTPLRKENVAFGVRKSTLKLKGDCKTPLLFASTRKALGDVSNKLLTKNSSKKEKRIFLTPSEGKKSLDYQKPEKLNSFGIYLDKVTVEDLEEVEEIEYAPPPEKEEPIKTELDGVMDELLKPLQFSDSTFDTSLKYNETTASRAMEEIYEIDKNSLQNFYENDFFKDLSWGEAELDAEMLINQSRLLKF